MKKLLKRTFGIISSFILGAQSKIFAMHQPAVYGPPSDPNITTLTGGQIFSIVASIMLFIIGLIVILNKKINKTVKVITVIVFSIIIISLLLLSKFVF